MSILNVWLPYSKYMHASSKRMYEEVAQLHVTSFNKCTLNYMYIYTCNLQKMFSPSYVKIEFKNSL